MTDERFNQLVNGPLGHFLPSFRITRLALALRDVIESCPEAEQAFERHCADREKRDREAAS